jgi:hypothetical protein
MCDVAMWGMEASYGKVYVKPPACCAHGDRPKREAQVAALRDVPWMMGESASTESAIEEAQHQPPPRHGLLIA